MPSTKSRQVPSLRLSTVLYMAERLPSLLGAHEIADLLNVSRQRVTQLTARPGFPKPVVELHAGLIWRKDEVIEWARTQGRIIDDTETSDQNHPGSQGDQDPRGSYASPIAATAGRTSRTGCATQRAPSSWRCSVHFSPSFRKAACVDYGRVVIPTRRRLC